MKGLRFVSIVGLFDCGFQCFRSLLGRLARWAKDYCSSTVAVTLNKIEKLAVKRALHRPVATVAWKAVDKFLKPTRAIRLIEFEFASFLEAVHPLSSNCTSVRSRRR